jgi:hypothetical protein
MIVESEDSEDGEDGELKPQGGVEEYDLINSLVSPDDPAILATSLKIASEHGWGVCRSRMAAIVAYAARQRGWRGDYERRALLWARYWKKPL